MATEHTQDQSWFKRHKILTGIGSVFLFFTIVSALGSPKEGQSTSTTDTATTTEVVEEVTTVTASQLFSDYKGNQVAADEKYKGKTIEVSGTITSIGKDILDTMYVSLKTGDIIGSVQCMLEDSELEKAAGLTQGQQITLTGEKPDYLMNVILRNCKIQ